MKGLGFVIGTAVGMIMNGVWFVTGAVCAVVITAKSIERKEKSEGVC